MRPLVVAAGAIAVAVVLFFVIRPSSDEDETATTTTSARTTVTTTARMTTSAPTRTRVAIVVRGGSVVGGLRHVTVKKGMPVELVVTADVSDEVHLHGYDRMRDVAPGAPAHLPFVATTPGRFEVELEDRQLQIAEITVEP